MRTHSAGADETSRGRRSLGPRRKSARHPDALDRYLDRLLDDALDNTFPASDALAVPTRRALEEDRAGPQPRSSVATTERTRGG